MVQQPVKAKLAQADLLLVPSHWTATVFSAAGLDNVQVVPLGYEPAVFYSIKKAQAQRPFVFGCAGDARSGVRRKNLEQVVRCFQAAFGESKEVRLHVKCRAGHLASPQPNVLVDTVRMSEAEVGHWHRALDCFVNLATGGFELHILQSMACGVPVVSHAFGGHTDYFHERNGLVVAHSLEPAQETWAGCGLWATVKDETLMEAMRWAARERAYAESIGWSAAYCVLELTWEKHGQRLAELLGEPEEAAPDSFTAPVRVKPVNTPAKPAKPVRVRLLYQEYTPDADTRGRIEFARTSWDLAAGSGVTVEFVPFRVSDLPRNAGEVGDDRQCPFVKDVFNYGLQGCDDDTVIAYVNADVALCQDWFETARPWIGQCGCWYSNRWDVSRFGRAVTPEWLARSPGAAATVGADLFTFTPEWWRNHRDQMPDMILGYEGWDFAFQLLMQASGFDPAKSRMVIYHERHSSFWSRSVNLSRHPAQVYCRKAGLDWATQRGLLHYVGGRHGYLFRGLSNARARRQPKGLPKLAILGLARNCAHTLVGLTRSLSPLLERWQCAAWVCAGDNDTAGALDAWQEEAMPVFQVAEPPARHGESRYGRLASLRNAVLDAWQESGFGAETVLWLDMDAAKMRDEGGLARVAKAEWSGVATLGLAAASKVNGYHCGPVLNRYGRDWVYYDTLALETVDGARYLWPDISHPASWYSHGTVPAGTTFLACTPPLKLDGWQEVNSAFGPATFYRWADIEGLRYDEHAQQCEHQSFHQSLRERGGRIALANDIIFLYA